MGQHKHRHDLVKGTVEMMVLGVLAEGSFHGLGIFDEISRRSGGVLEVAEGSLYPALKKMEAEGLIESEWKPSRNNRRARYYQLTESGLQQLATKCQVWDEFSRAVAKVLSTRHRTETAFLQSALAREAACPS